MRIKPFRALRPDPAVAAEVASVPYDVVDRDEAARLAAGNPLSFLHVARPDIDLPEDTDPYDPAVYHKGRENLDRLVAGGVLVPDETPSLYVYRQEMDGRAQTGVVACVHADDYENDLIRKHEKTRKDKEDDRTRHLLTLEAHAEPVFLTYRGRGEIDRLVAAETAAAPLYDFTAPDGVRHAVWKVADPGAMVRQFGEVPLLYVADGHHRSAGAWRAARELRGRNPSHDGTEEYNWFLAVVFPAEQLRILPYNRVVKDLNGRAPEAFETELASLGRVIPTDDPTPPRAGTFCFYAGGRWLRLELDEAAIDRSDPIGSLDVSLLQERVLGPLLGVADPRTDKRIDFVGGIRGPRELQRRVDGGLAAVAVSMYPTTLDQLLAVSDAGAIMPPKSTWFEPKLRSGLFIHPWRRRGPDRVDRPEPRP